MKIKYLVKSSENGYTIRQWSKLHFPLLSYQKLQQHLRQKDILSQHGKLSPQSILHTNDVLHVWQNIAQNNKSNLKELPLHTFQFVESRIIEQTENFIVVNKPYDIASQGGTNIHISLIEVVNQWINYKNIAEKAYLVHRLDRCTTGVMIFALNRNAATEFGETIHKWKKIYTAIIPKSELQNQTKKHMIEVHERQIEAITSHKIIRSNEQYSIIELYPKTGRMHQLRQYCEQYLHPIIGDVRYGSKYKGKMQLHCTKISFSFLGKTFEFDAPKPNHMQKLMNTI